MDVRGGATSDRFAHALAASGAALDSYDILGTPPEPAFDDLARLAGALCEAPVALFTLFESGRQWMKAKIGYDGPEPAPQDSLCRHAIDAGDLLVIPDLADDPRSRDDLVVQNAPHARFYAAASIRSPEGVFVGTLCVIDFAPRPKGLTPAQADGLKALARQVMAMLELRRLVRDRDTAAAASAQETERLRADRADLISGVAQWRGLFDGLSEGFMIGKLVRDATGTAVDWRHLEINRAFLATIDQPAEAVVGHTIRDIASHVADDLVPFIAGVVADGRPATFARQIGSRGRQFEGRAFPIGGDQFAVLFLDVTERVAASRRQAALIVIADRLRDLHRIDDMTAEVSRVVGETLDASRAGYGRLDARRELITMEPDWTRPGVASIAGEHRFTDYGDLLNELLIGEPLVIDDVQTDPRTAADPGPMLGLSIGALVNMPVRERGRTVAVFFVHADQPRRWTADELTFLRDVADRVEVEVVRLETDARRIIQNEELSHRLKNTLAMVQAIASQTLKPLADRSVVETFERRLTTLATAHGVLLAADWEAAPLDQVVRSVIDSAGQDGRATLSGPAVPLSPRAVLSISLVMHELATNAVKYGALSVPDGMVEISWRIAPGPHPAVALEWRECGGPPAVVPTRRGFGSRLINMGLVGTGGVKLDYSPTGLVASMAAPLDDLIKQ